MIDKKYIVSLKGKDFVLWAGLLDAATTAGLRSIQVTLLQHPTPENGGLAIAEATVTFKDERIFTEIGDAGPANCSPMIAPHACRMAATRAKGRALRDALNIAETMVEELGPDAEAAPAPPAPAQARSARMPAAAPQPPVQPATAPDAALDAHCSWKGCKQPLSAAELAQSTAAAGRPLCPPHLELAKALPRCSQEECHVVISQSTAAQTLATYGRALCARHAAEAPPLERDAATAGDETP